MHPIDEMARPLALIMTAVFAGYFAGLALRTWWCGRHKPVSAYARALDALRVLLTDNPPKVYVELYTTAPPVEGTAVSGTYARIDRTGNRETVVFPPMEPPAGR